MNTRLQTELRAELERLRGSGAYKAFSAIDSPQGPFVGIPGRGRVMVLSSNDYLGLAARREVIEAAHEALARYGAGTASVRFICGTLTLHLELERELAEFLGCEAALTYASCWHANLAVIPTLSDEQTVILSDALNHASIVDAIRLARCERKVVYPHADLAALEAALKLCRSGQRKLIVTDGVFSMEGDVAPLAELSALARAYDAVLVVDDSHGTGVLGATGRGTPEHCDVLGEIDVLTGTLGKALGGAAGGFVAGSRALCEVLAQRSRPHLFSNAISPPTAAGALAAVRLLRREESLLARLRANTSRFRAGLEERGFGRIEGATPIIPIVLGDTAVATAFGRDLLDRGVMVTGFGYPVVPEGEARVRVQISAAFAEPDLETALTVLEEVRSLHAIPAAGRKDAPGA